MSQYHCSMKANKFKHITERERYQIEILLQEKKKPQEIAKALGKNRRTIEREITRGKVRMLTSELTYKEKYCADTAQLKYLKSSQNKGACLKIGHDHELACYIEKRIIRDKYSPDAVIGEIRAKGKKFKTSICTKTLYNYIDKEIFANISNKDLPVKRNGKKKNYKRIRIGHKNLKGTSIEDRPTHIKKREEYGHWEMDCVVGKRGESKAALLVLTERSSRKEIIRKISDRTQVSVLKEINKLEKEKGNRFYQEFKTMTVDNGSEFLNWQQLEASIRKRGHKRFKLYYAHPYSSWERGSNENANKLIRRFIPKGTDLNKLTHRYIKRIEDWMNNYPRRILGYKCARDVIVA